ncbi:helix-turn-helix transcriptional regulator [Tenacibaculum sp. S7007]|uniref:Helix-turn-helix transcriptional regulator n=1 Tax=Tenacibaculum pelagium TaxID=2759527 RepID=A0A839AS94_9FLAO|nr:helix-turn-helix transcriptional regulator [Tenacibaculum pelagium]MBA6156511.1 helix-turn-helix transcriptional regulator [Tenacibaculum pelagium]
MKKDSVLVKFGNKVRQLRNEKGWSQEELSFKSGFHRTYIGMVERAERNISLKNIERIAKTFNIEIQDLFTNKN